LICIVIFVSYKQSLGKQDSVKRLDSGYLALITQAAPRKSRVKNGYR
jgi:hypothetical protein